MHYCPDFLDCLGSLAGNLYAPVLLMSHGGRPYELMFADESDESLPLDTPSRIPLVTCCRHKHGGSQGWADPPTCEGNPFIQQVDWQAILLPEGL
jgi:hypothetical protein